jgi:quercetin dioxygenase-like cupin family protein
LGESNYAFLKDIQAEMPAIPPNGTLSRTVFKNNTLKVVLFGFDAGQELSEHTASSPAILHFLSGEARLTLGGEKQSAHPGSWVYMPSHLPHSIQALEPTIAVLLLIKGGNDG